MSTPIQFPNLPQNQPYCQYSDVENLIGSTIGFQNVDTTVVQSFINQATKFIETQTQKKFSPYRMKRKYDGNGSTSLILRDNPIINLNEVDVWFTYPLNVERVSNDWNMIVDRSTSQISFPPFTDQPIFAPWGFQFYPGLRNVTVDAWFGHTQDVWGEVPSSSDNLTFTLANPTAVKQTADTVYGLTETPVFYPKVYVDGNLLVNTTYVQESVSVGEFVINNIWQVETDNIYYTVNTSANGITGFTFNQAPSGTVTVDYSYWLVPYDAVDVTAKKTAIMLLQSFGTSLYSGIGDDSANGADSIQTRTGKVTYTSGAWGKVISSWQADIAEFIKRRKSIQIPFVSGYTDNFYIG